MKTFWPKAGTAEIATTPPEIQEGDVVCITAVDWGLYYEQLPRDTVFQIVRGKLYGEVVCVFAEGVALAPQVFTDGGVRNVLTIPWRAIEEVARWQR